MKNKMFGKYFASIMMCALAWAVVGCSEPSTAGGTVDGNSVADFSADEKAILEHQVDSTKAFADAENAAIGDHAFDSTVYWFEIYFKGKRENYFAYEQENPYSNCYVSVYPSEYGVQTIGYGSMLNGIAGYIRTFFLTAGDEGVVYHEKLDGCYYDEYSCEKDYADFEKSCNAEGRTLFRHLVRCQDSPTLHLTCSSSEEHLTESPEAVLEHYAEKMKNWCLENR